MYKDNVEPNVARVAACTAAAAHRRDHHHAPSPGCHPHAIEVVHLGHRAVAVCHDCEADTGFIPVRQAEAVAQTHHRETMDDRCGTLGALVSTSVVVPG